MKGLSIAEIKQMLEMESISRDQLSSLQNDSRKGVHKLLKGYEQKQQKMQKMEQHFADMCRFEERCYGNGCERIAGMDEAGRGPLAGPVVAAAVILPKGFKLLGLDDSKQLNERKRNEFYTIIKNQAVSYGISVVTNETIDQVNIYEATKLAMRDALGQLDPSPDHVLIDAVPLNNLPYTSESITKGDQKSISIAAASIIAKVTRDTIMKKIHNDFPCYAFESNMGYGTRQHINAIGEYGISPFHRKSFEPVKHAIS
ncbi:ribonuclease HII [Virgibacillus phasianinus]|uniref:Ribonuclease HII n=1 Tax=Virgibacillus phasianinus TaxID=2017483 RepID=A0A220U5V4_9BACI|nr:ribonuclease HII [Virgibacillus phasianinus]ASK63507.1 ribonuclease HII [Virgibacillus phasianinus]